MKLFISLVLVGFLVLSVSSKAFGLTPLPTPTSQPTQESYVLFYPVVSGKTDGESLYFLKLVRDRLTEIFSFGNEKKSEVNLQIATKRLLEAEKLLKNEKENLVQNTLSKFNTKLAASYDNAIKAADSDFFPELLDQINSETGKYLIVLNQMLARSPEEKKDFISETIERVTEIQNKIQAELGNSN